MFERRGYTGGSGQLAVELQRLSLRLQRRLELPDFEEHHTEVPEDECATPHVLEFPRDRKALLEQWTRAA